MLEKLGEPTKAQQLIKDTLASFLADIDHMTAGEPRLVILQKPGVSLVMLGGTAAREIQTSADQPLSRDQVMELARRAPELRAQAAAKVPSAPAKAPDLVDPELAAAARAIRMAGSKYRCWRCRKESHKGLSLFDLRPLKLPYNLDEAYCCGKCKRELLGEAPGKPQDVKAAAAAPSPLPAPEFVEDDPSDLDEANLPDLDEPFAESDF